MRIKTSELLFVILSESSTKRQRIRALAVFMFVLITSLGLKISKANIAFPLLVSERSVHKWIKNYSEKGIESLLQNRHYKPQSELEKYSEEIKANLDAKPCATAKEASKRIEELTGIKRGLTQTKAFIKKLGFKHLRTGQIPAKADVEKQKEFLENELEPKLEEQRKGNEKLFFVDASHFVMYIHLGMLWCLERVFVRSSCGRQRYNVLAALDSITQEIITITNNAYINSQSVCDLMRKIRTIHETEIITLVMDNARYQRCALVMDLAKELKIEILFLPSYSPNLNLIERLWKFVKKECLNATHYENFNDFTSAIDNCLSETQGKHREALKTLITTNFQLFDEIKELRRVA